MTVIEVDQADLNLKHLFVQSLLTFVRQSFSILCQLASVVILARFLGPIGNGQFTVAVSASMLLANLLNLGVPAANVFFVGGKCVSPRIALIASIRIWGALVIVGAIVSIFFILGFSESFFRGIPKHVFWIALAVFPITLLYTFLASILQGQQDFRRYNTTLIIPALVSLLAALILVCTMRLGVIGAMLSWGIGQIAGLAGSLLLLRTCWVESKEGHVDLSVPPPYMSRCLSYGWKAHLSNLISFLNYRADLFLVNFFLGPAGAGVYSVAIQIAERLWLFSQAVSTVLLPRLAQLNSDEIVRKHLTPLVARWVLYTTFFLAMLLALFVKPLVHFLFGNAYQNVAQTVLILLPGIVVFSCARVLANDIAARGRLGINIWTTTIALVISVTANVFLIPHYGISGAALGVTLTFSLATMINMIFYSHISRNHWLCPLMIEDIDRRILLKLMSYTGFLTKN